METYLDLTNGLHTDFEPIDQPSKTYRYLKDAIRQVSGAIENEKGTSLITTLIGDDRKIIGSYVLDDDIVFFSYSPTLKSSEIGILDTLGVYTIITNDLTLAFTLNIIVRAEGKKNFKGERIIYFVAKGLPFRILNIDNVPLINFDDNTRLILTASMPQVKVISVGDGGSLPTGEYQFATRLLTKSTNATSISILTNPVPIIDEDSSNKDNADGAPPQTESNKSIVLQILNIDKDYEFIEIIAITFIGNANVTKSDIIARIPIQGRDTINFTYSNSAQIRQSLDINALTANPANYNSAEFISQKDGILELAGLSTEQLDYNFQSAANKITVKYVIREELWNESIQIANGVDIGTTYPVLNDYKNPLIDYEYKSYMRDEVYSFAISPIFSNWSTGFAYHIPAPVVKIGGLVQTSYPANTTTKSLGTYTSSESYPINKGYPNTDSIQVRHHKMPSLVQEPHIQVRNGTTFIRMLGVSFDLTDFLSTIPDITKKNIIGYVISKQKRDATNKSILSQGVATGLQTHYIGGAAYYNSIPFSGSYPTFNLNNQEDLTVVAFYSPESIITKESLKSATSIVPVIEIAGTSYVVGDKRTEDKKFAHILLNYNSTKTTSSLLNNSRLLNTSSTQYIDAGPELNADAANLSLPSTFVTGITNKISNWRTPGYLALKISNGSLPSINNVTGPAIDLKGEVYYKVEIDATDNIYLNGIKDATTGTTSRFLYNLNRPLQAQYGAVYDAKYHYIKHILIQDITSPIIECYNGDTFITKFAVMSSSNSLTNEEGSVDLKGLSYFWIESGINTGYRHYKLTVGKEGDANYIQGTIPYYPKFKRLSSVDNNNLGIFNFSSSLGHPVGYNKQYSFENTINSYIPTPLELEVVSHYDNRIIYSEQSIEGEQLDAFRILLPNNYHDIPKEKGKITNLFILNNRLHVHTERSLWRTYFNEQVTQASSAGEVYLGNGGVFNRPSTEIMSVKGGYAGAQSSSGCTTPFGHFFLDEIQKKVFMFSDELKEISDQGMFKYFKKNVSRLENTPSLGIGYSSVYDYQNKRWLLTKIGQWTLSYSTQLNSWSSFHSYTPYHYVSVGDRLYSTDLNTINEMNTGIYGVFYGGLPQDLQVDIVINDSAKDTKTLDNVIFYTTSQNVDGIEQHYDTFSTLQAYNTTKNTGKCRLVVPKSFEDEFIPLSLFECFAKLKSNEFRVAIPSDLVIDVTKSIFDVNNLDTSRAYRPRMSGKYFVVSFSYNNLRDNKFILHNIGRLFRQRIR